MPHESAAGYLHDPSLWIGKAPSRGVGSRTGARDDVVLRAELRSGVRVKVFRDGVFVFDLAAWRDDLPVPKGKDRPRRVAARMHRRAAILNTHVACLHTAMSRLDSTVTEKMVVTPRNMLHLAGLDARRSSTDDGRVRAMVDSRGRHASASGDAVRFGRFQIPRPVRVRKKTVALSLQMLDDVLRSRAPVGTSELIELALHASKAIEEQRYTFSLEIGWVVTERLLQVMWDAYMTTGAAGPGGEARVISSTRRRHLKDPRTYPSAVVAEILSLADVLPPELHRSLTTVRAARDAWLQEARFPRRKDARRASSLASEMLWKAEGIDLSLEPAPRRTR